MSQIIVTPARKEKLADTVYGQILFEITSGKFTEGDKLPSEAELSLAFDVSRPVVREALLRLSTDGLIQSRRGIGTFISTKPSTRLTELADAADLSSYVRSFEPRIVIEVEAARLAAMRRSRGHLEAIRQAIDDLNEAIVRGELGQAQDIAFHDAVAIAAGNEYFPVLLKDLRRPVQETMNIGLELARERAPARRLRVVEEHTRILNAISVEDSDSAASYMKYHLLQARAAILDAQHLEAGRLTSRRSTRGQR
ncbi:FadR/GntR family transcriptional regulator [Agrobacterium sp. lyk4-40-TYG-31]|uniref:FadR/GntR family transcriptional regulator n=1 Tax=Agrobacterium sp. lyk4-40-TYG-31 TaxID=3040276 RepID=UPI00254FE36E|nr:FadR/GntR family transcriptional regulator [Agrobacterium sp. lyk4-40-TYG-31]